MILGILGGIGSGKSTVTGLLVELGAEALDADQEVHAALAEDDVKDELRSWWGDAVFDARGDIDRSAVAARVFDNAEMRSRLEKLLHPRVRARLETGIKRFQKEHSGTAADRLLILDVPLLAASPFKDQCDELVFIETEIEQRVEQTRERGWSPDEVLRREAIQTSIEEKRNMATRHLDNRSSLPRLRRQVEELYESLMGAKTQGRE